MVSTAGIETVDVIEALRGLSVAFKLLVADGLVSQSEVIRFQNRLPAEQVHSAPLLLNDDLCHRRPQVPLQDGGLRAARGQSREHRERKMTAVRSKHRQFISSGDYCAAG